MKLPNYCKLICFRTVLKIQYASNLQLEFAGKLQSLKEAYYTEPVVSDFRCVIFIEELPPKKRIFLDKIINDDYFYSCEIYLFLVIFRPNRPCYYQRFV